ncbi:glycosyltransferase family 1 protein [Georgenia deserti]|uniref:Glycosyltransferase family 1 protein n=1 Tax=Georgenia deserti TaxID=2093781 RepID=A0ABW4LAP0_9MICO
MKAITGAVRIARREGLRALTQRAARLAYHRSGAWELDEPLPAADIADSASLRLPSPRTRPARSHPLTIGWVTTPPGAGSGGHTTLLRMVEAVERAGHRCVLFLTDRFDGDLADHTRVIREWWPQVRASVRDARQGITGVDAAVASSWESAHVLASRGTEPMHRLYFVQDYEPWFYARGAVHALAEDTYRFGFRTIALGEAVASALRDALDLEPEVTSFGCDTSVYRPLTGAERTGVVAYARPGVARRGFELTRLSLARFHTLRPDVPIHLYGDVVSGLPFPAVQHGRLTPTELNELYNTCVAGVAPSFTNISLVAEEMLAAGTVPVVNDSVYARADLPNPAVAWTRPTPDAFAQALADTLDHTEPDVAERAARTVRQDGWSRAQADVVRIIEDEVYGRVAEVAALRPDVAVRQ